MFIIGCHLSSSAGYLAMGKEAVRIGANDFQFFTRNPRGGAAKPLDLDDIRSFEEYRKENGIISVLAHAPYTMNACSKDAGLREFAKNNDVYLFDLASTDLFTDENEDIMQANIDKLKKRYPDGFEIKRSVIRLQGDL